jgi:ABC-type multidrug transport system fused ATPase/permease subunit
MNTIRRFWFYAVTLVALGIFAAGVERLLSLIFQITIKSAKLTQVGGTNFNQTQLSLGLALTAIGGPLWLLFWRAIQRRVKGNQEETGAVMRKFFLNFVLLVSAFILVVNAAGFLKWLISGASADAFSPGGLALVIVAGVIWFYHYRVSESEGHPSSAAKTMRRWYVYIMSVFGLVMLAVSLVLLINAAFRNLPVWGDVLVAGKFWNTSTQGNAAWIVFGLATWYFHWFRMARGDFNSKLRQVYFYLPAISGGAVAALVSASILLFQVFVWIFSGTGAAGSRYFQFLGWAVPTILVGLAIWGYHQRLAQEEAGRVQEKRQSARRVYFYLMAFLGLATTVIGLSILFGLLVETGTQMTVTAGWWRHQLATALAMLVVGTPLWLYYWNGILKRVRAGGIDEWRALSRRIFLYVIIGAAIVLLAADMVTIIYELLRDTLGNRFSANFLNDAKWGLQTLAVAAGLLWYHWQILRADQRRGAETMLTKRDITILADDRGGDLAVRLENRLGYKTHILYLVGQTGAGMPPLAEEEIERLVNEIQSAAADKLMLVMLDGRITVMPYRDK